MANIWAKEKLATAIKNNSTIAGTLRELKIKDPYNGGYYRKFHRHVKEYGLDTDHFKGRAHLKGETHNYTPNKRKLTEILVKNSDYTHTSRLKRRLIATDLLEEKCEQCGLTKHWNGKQLTLQLDHINGNSCDNRLENLRILCPNCHSQTNTYAGRSASTASKPNTCADCNKKISKRAERCLSCAAKHREQTTKTERPEQRKFDPNPDKLEKLVWEMPAYKVGKKFGVSGQAIKKRCQKYDIETPSRGYWQKKKAGKFD